jgi:hypothetical protein
LITAYLGTSDVEKLREIAEANPDVRDARRWEAKGLVPADPRAYPNEVNGDEVIGWLVSEGVLETGHAGDLLGYFSRCPPRGSPDEVLEKWLKECPGKTGLIKVPEGRAYLVNGEKVGETNQQMKSKVKRNRGEVDAESLVLRLKHPEPIMPPHVARSILKLIGSGYLQEDALMFEGYSVGQLQAIASVKPETAPGKKGKNPPPKKNKGKKGKPANTSKAGAGGSKQQ